MSEANKVELTLSDLEKLTEKKLNEKDEAILTLTKQLDEIKASASKKALDDKDSQIASLKDSLNKLESSVSDLKKVSDTQKVALDESVIKIDDLNKLVASKDADLKKAVAEVEQSKKAKLIASRIKEYRDKTGDTELTDENITKEFGELTDGAFATVIKYAKKADNTDKTVEQATASLLKDSKKVEDKVVAPTNTENKTDPIQSVAANLFSSVFKTEEKKN